MAMEGGELRLCLLHHLGHTSTLGYFFPQEIPYDSDR